MNVLVAHGSKRGGTAEIAQRIGDVLRARGFDVHVAPAHEVRDLRKYDAVLVGGALYAGRWVGEARQFVLRHRAALRERHVWFFSSGPLDDSARAEEIAPTPQVAELLAHVGANGHVTFGGRLLPDAHGFVASSMAKKRAGDWRDMPHVEAWACEVALHLESNPLRARRSPATFPPLPSRALIVSLSLAAGLSAIAGGACLVARPDGSLIQMSPSILVHSPFHDFLVPGLLLLIVIGMGNTWSAILHLRRSDAAAMTSLVAGLALIVWVLVEITMLRSFHAVQGAYLVLGIAIVGVSAGALRMMFGNASRVEHTAPTHP
jgi:menaquinone-dependent protoporphyrinogen oxidase